MAAEGFFQRWSRVKAEAVPEADPPEPLDVAEPAPNLPTLADAEAFDAGSDFSPFVGKGVDKAVHRLALKKLFSDPHFNLKDGLDIYMDDYNRLDPVSPLMLGALAHAQSFLVQAAASEPDVEPDDPARGEEA